MTPIFETVKEQMDQMVKIDLTKLEYLNSSGIKSIVSFVMGKDPKYKIIFIADSGKIWQKTSLEVIKSLDENNIVIETR
ncbi:MAG: hypothetical protein GY699_08330 [Desulfobacteraceae bacterium]|nr:hypothetical protein [Desulfobacteraceae bacterium]